MEGCQNSHAKLLAIDFLSLTPRSATSFFLPLQPSATFTRAETLGMITTHDLKPSKFLRFTVDDSTGSVPCVLWLNHLTSPYFSRRSPADVAVIAHVASQQADLVRIGEVIRVRAKIGVFRGTVQMTVTDLVCERDPNAEILHWLECLRLSRRRRTRTATNDLDPEVSRVKGKIMVFRGTVQMFWRKIQIRRYCFGWSIFRLSWRWCGFSKVAT